MAEKVKVKPTLYVAELTKYGQTSPITKGYTHAYSFKQAMRNLSFDFPYPEWVMQSMTNTVTQQRFTLEEWREASKYEPDN
jgi:hypothetical protein